VADDPPTHEPLNNGAFAVFVISDYFGEHGDSPVFFPVPFDHIRCIDSRFEPPPETDRIGDLPDPGLQLYGCNLFFFVAPVGL